MELIKTVSIVFYLMETYMYRVQTQTNIFTREHSENIISTGLDGKFSVSKLNENKIFYPSVVI